MAGNSEGKQPPRTALPAPCTGTARSARATPTRSRGEARTPREHKRTHSQRKRGADPKGNGTDCMKWRTAGEGKGHPGGTTHNTHREGREGREEPKGRRKNRHRPRPPRPAASAAHTQPGHCTRQGSSSTQCYAPAPRLGSLHASPWGSHWRPASSTGAPAPAPRATEHQGAGLSGKRLQPRLLSDALTGEWRNGEAGEGQGSKPCEPGGLRHQAGGVS